MVGPIHSRVDGRAGELRLCRQLVPGPELAIERDTVGFRKTLTTARIGFCHGDEMDLAGMSPGVCTIGVIAAPAGADQDQLERRGVLLGQRPISRIHTIRTPTNSKPINSVSS